MSKGKKKTAPPVLRTDPRMDPSTHLTERFDSNSIAEFTVAKPGKMGMRVMDNAAEEHQM